jgi:hypothetical protein
VRRKLLKNMVLLEGIELSTSPLPNKVSTICPYLAGNFRAFGMCNMMVIPSYGNPTHSPIPHTIGKDRQIRADYWDD